MKKVRGIIYILCSYLFIFLFSTVVYAFEQGTVIFDNASLRIAPNNTATVLFTLNNGDKVNIADDKIDDWYQLDNHLYIRKDYVQLQKIVESNAHILLSENVIHTKEGFIPLSPGDKIQILGYENGTIKAEFLGFTGYIYHLDDSPLTDRDDGVKSLIIMEALNYVGYPYQYGGNSLMTGTDCSGFIQLIHKNFNINLERSSAMQYLVNGYFIDESQIQEGDLIFYGENNQVTHVALYIGNGQIVHAASEKQGICISNMEINIPVLGIKRI